jgi:phosphonate transport system substrate-binding protein
MLTMTTRAGETAPAAETHYTFGVFPYLSPQQLSQSYGPVAADFSRVLNRSVRFTSAPTYEAFTQSLTEEIYDIAMIQPFDYVDAVDQRGYQPLARVDADLRANFVVRPDSPFKTVEDLRGTRVALPSAPAAVSRMALKALKDAGLQPGVDVQVRHFKSFGSCMQDVLVGNSSACATGKAAKAIFEKRMQVSLRIMYETPAIPHMTFIVHQRVPEPERERLRSTIINWNKTTDGQRIVKGMRFPGFRAVVDQEYDVIRRYENVRDVRPQRVVQKAQLVLGVLPYFPPRRMAEHLAPVPKALSRATGRPVVLRSATTFAQFASHLQTGLYDVALIQPFDYQLAIKHGYVPLARRERDITTVFYVLEDGKLRSLNNLKGTVVAMPPYEAAVSHMGRQALRESGMRIGQDVQIRYRRDHISCLRQVLLAQTSACVSAQLALTSLSDTERQKLVELHRTPPIAGVAFVAHARLPENLRTQLKDEILSWAKTDDGKALLEAIDYEPFVPIKPGDYACCTAAEE